MKKILTSLTLALFTLLFLGTVNAQTISTIAGLGFGGYSGDGGPASAATFNVPYGIAIDAAGNLYIADRSNHAIRKISTTGMIKTIAGNGTAGFSGDGGPATAAQLSNPYTVAVDPTGNVFICDFDNSRIRKVDLSGHISTYAGGGFSSSEGIPATNASLDIPCGVATDLLGNVYIPEQGGNKVRKVSTSGIIRTVAGNGVAAFGGDGGPATNAYLYAPTNVAVDNAGNLFISDRINERIRLVDLTGTIYTIAGDAFLGYGGEGLMATGTSLYFPWGICVDAAQNVYTFEQLSRARKIDLYGYINTFVGNGTYGYTGDGGPATDASINGLYGGVFDAAGNMYIVDAGSNVIRKITNNNHAPSFVGGPSSNLTLCENASAPINSILAFSDLDIGQTEAYGMLVSPSNGTIAGFPFLALSTGGIITPVGFSYTPTTGYSGTDTFALIVYDDVALDTMFVYVTVNPLPATGAITGSSSLCQGATTLLSESVSGGVWTSSDVSKATISTGGMITGLSGGIVVMSYTVTNACGTLSATQNILINPLPVAGTISGNDTILCGGGAYSSTTSGGTWSLANTSVGTISGAGAVTSVVTTSMEDSVIYVVTNSCGADTAYFPFFYNCDKTGVGVVATNRPYQLQIYPNPATGDFIINVPAANNEPVLVVIANITGEKIATYNMSTNQNFVANLGQPEGVYFITATLQNTVITGKLIIAR